MRIRATQDTLTISQSVLPVVLFALFFAGFGAWILMEGRSNTRELFGGLVFLGIGVLLLLVVRRVQVILDLPKARLSLVKKGLFTPPEPTIVSFSDIARVILKEKHIQEPAAGDETRGQTSIMYTIGIQTRAGEHLPLLDIGGSTVPFFGKKTAARADTVAALLSERIGVPWEKESPKELDAKTNFLQIIEQRILHRKK